MLLGHAATVAVWLIPGMTLWDKGQELAMPFSEQAYNTSHILRDVWETQQELVLRHQNSPWQRLSALYATIALFSRLFVHMRAPKLQTTTCTLANCEDLFQ